MESAHKTYTFTLLLLGPSPLDHLDALFQAGCADATLGEREGMFFGEFDRTADSLAEAVGNAIAQVESAVRPEPEPQGVVQSPGCPPRPPLGVAVGVPAAPGSATATRTGVMTLTFQHQKLEYWGLPAAQTWTSRIRLAVSANGRTCTQVTLRGGK